MIVYNFEPVLEGGRVEQHFGIGYDQDLNERLSIGATFRMSETANWVVNYRSAYHFSDASSTSMYFGPTVGLRQVTNELADTKMLVPLGFRWGVRGGLRRFYADLYVGGQYNVGSSQPMDDRARTSVRPLTFCAGLDFGWGWD